jgi:hypothetical protein
MYEYVLYLWVWVYIHVHVSSIGQNVDCMERAGRMERCTVEVPNVLERAVLALGTSNIHITAPGYCTLYPYMLVQVYEVPHNMPAILGRYNV